MKAGRVATVSWLQIPNTALHLRKVAVIVGNYGGVLYSSQICQDNHAIDPTVTMMTTGGTAVPKMCQCPMSGSRK